MANIANTNSKLVWVKSMARGQCFPLDATEIWYSLEDAKNYAATDSTAYVGQTLKVVDETNNTVSVYVITDAAGTLVRLADPVQISEALGVALDGLCITNGSPDTLEWDAIYTADDVNFRIATDGTDDDSNDGRGVCYVSDIVLTPDDVTDSVALSFADNNDTWHTSIPDADHSMVRTDGFIALEAEAENTPGNGTISMWVFGVPTDNYDVYAALGWVFPKAGIYIQPAYPGKPCSLTINNYTGFPFSKKLDENALPDVAATKDYVKEYVDAAIGDDVDVQVAAIPDADIIALFN